MSEPPEELAHIYIYIYIYTTPGVSNSLGLESVFSQSWPMDCSMLGFCLSPSPRAYSNSCLLSRWCHSTILSSVVPFPFCLQSFLASGSFPMSRLCIRWPKYWSFRVSISPSNEYSGLISFRMDWLDLLAVQGTLKSLLQHQSSKHQFFGAQPSLWFNSHIHIRLLEKP